MSTENRMRRLHDFYQGDYQVMVATDLASRGLDFENVSHIIMYDFAQDAVSFLHRAGRTARMGKEGRITAFIKPQDEFLFGKIKEVLDKGQNLESVFSRKRSLRKNENRTAKQDKESEGEEEEEEAHSEQPQTKNEAKKWLPQ